MSSSGSNECDPPGLTVPWIVGADLAKWAGIVIGSETALADEIASMASDVMFELSGRQFFGTMTRKVRPCRTPCNFWGNVASGMTYWTYAMTSYGYGGRWQNENGDTCGCGSESYIRLAGYPVCSIQQVKLDGAALAPTDYRLDKRRDLIYMADVTKTPPTERFWPSCQRLDLDDDQPGTFSVTYTWGLEPPALGEAAAGQLGGEIWKALHGSDCKLPSRATKIVRSGVTLEKIISFADAFRKGASGLTLVDLFIAQTNPQLMRRGPLVISPDIQRPARKVGQ